MAPNFKIDRRALLQAMAGAGAVLPLGGARALAELRPKAVVFSLSDIGPETPVDKLRVVLRPFVARNIPVGCIVSPEADGAKIEIGSELAVFLRRFLGQYPGLGELIAWAPDIASAKPYFKMRMASAAVHKLSQALGLFPLDPQDALRPLSIAGWAGSEEVSHDAVRVAGIRNVLLFPKGQKAIDATWCSGSVPCTQGGFTHHIADDPDLVLQKLGQAVEADPFVQVAVSLNGLAEISDDVLSRHATAAAQSIKERIRAGRVFAELPRDRIAWSGLDAARLITLILETPFDGDPAKAARAEAFADELAKAGFPVALARAQSGDRADTGAWCLFSAGDGKGLAIFDKTGPEEETNTTEPPCEDTQVVDASMRSTLAEAGVNIWFGHPGDSVRGVDETGAFQLGSNRHLDGFASRRQHTSSPESLHDLVVTITGTAIETQADRDAIINHLKYIKDSSYSAFLDIRSYAETLLAHAPVYHTFRTSRAHHAIYPDVAQNIDPAEKELLLQDARLAWCYFDQLTNPETGLCPSTVQFAKVDQQEHRKLTMWDIGSLIQAVVAAKSIGLIDQDEFVGRSTAILNSLPAVPIAGLTLPCSEISIDTPSDGTTDFNICDTARLFSALKALSEFPAMKDPVAALVSRWDVEQTVRNGRIFAIDNGRFVDAHGSHCAHYASASFAHWGIDVDSPYAAMAGDTPADAQMNLLYEVARIGSLGAEPLLLNGLELGFTKPTSYLSDVLFDMQRKAYRDTGKFHCVSEAPMNEAPWFTYQGLLVDAPAGANPWDVAASPPQAKYENAEFRQRALMVSSKAAFLWWALRPTEYSRGLVDLVRRKGRIPGRGYASGIYSNTGKATENYGDINTNGIILQSVAHVMKAQAGVASD